jgi:hypothetical protein
MARRNPVNSINPFGNVNDPVHQAIIRKERTWITSVDPKVRLKQLKALAKKETQKRLKLKSKAKVVDYEIAKNDFIKRNASLGMNNLRFELLRTRFVELTKLPEFKSILKHNKPGIELFIQTKLIERVLLPFKNPVTGVTEVRMVPFVNVPTPVVHPFVTFAVHNVNNYGQLRPAEKVGFKKKRK